MEFEDIIPAYVNSCYQSCDQMMNGYTETKFRDVDASSSELKKNLRPDAGISGK